MQNLASHVCYLEQGSLRFSEEITALGDRFREVELTLDKPSPAPGNLPPTWMHVNASAAVLRFVETRFDEGRTSAEIRRLFADVRDVTFSPMSLRSIFLAMAKAGRDSA